MKKILFLIESLSGGGAEKVLTELVKNLDKTKFDITVMTIVNIGVYVDEVKSVCTYRSFLCNPKDISNNLLKLIFKIRYKLIYSLPSSIIYRWFIKDKYDVEVAFIEGFATKIISNSSNFNSKKIAWVHTDMSINNSADKCFKSHKDHISSYNSFDKILCVSKGVAVSFNKKFNLSKEIIVQYNPIDKQKILQKSIQPIDLNKDRLVMVTVGRLVNQKGYDRLIKICKRLKDDGFKFYLLIIGEGEQRSTLEKYVYDNCLEDTIKLMGFQSNPYPYIRIADIFVCSSRVEGFSTVVAEAVILGKAVITTDCSGMNELLGSNEYGIITKNDTDSLYFELKKVLMETKIINYYSEKSKLRSKKFTLENTMKMIEQILIG